MYPNEYIYKRNHGGVFVWNKVLYGKSRRRRPMVLGCTEQEDAQGAIPAGWCIKCGREVFAAQEALCDRCRAMERRKMMKELSPCLTCTRVREPRDCENKNCRVWRQWFLKRWEQLRSIPKQQMEAAKPQPLGVCVGGQTYAAPNQVENYLKKDPCNGCLCPRDLCTEPCRVKRAWEDARNEVLL